MSQICHRTNGEVVAIIVVVFLLFLATVGGDPSLFSYARTSYFTVKLVGRIPDVPSQTNMGSTESQISTLEAIDTAQVHMHSERNIQIVGTLGQESLSFLRRGKGHRSQRLSSYISHACMD